MSTITHNAAEHDTFRFRLEFTDDELLPAHAELLPTAAFHRAVRETYFTGFRQAVFPTYQPKLEQARVEPYFAGEADPTRVDTFRVVVPRPNGGDFWQDFSFNYFLQRALMLRAEIERSQSWPKAKPLYFTLRAYLDEPQICPANSDLSGLTIDSESVCVPVRSSRRQQHGLCEQWDGPQPDDLPVQLARSVLEDGCHEAAQHAQRETGGLLVGHLCRDHDDGETFVRVTSLVSGEGTTQATGSSITFTAESFTKAREMIRLRARSGIPEETVVGWYHSHPFRFCSNCPLPTAPECIQKILFYSCDDLQLMESTFFQPFHVGVLVAVETKLEDALGHLPVRLFGWRHGEIKSRGFEVYDG